MMLCLYVALCVVICLQLSIYFSLAEFCAENEMTKLCNSVELLVYLFFFVYII